MGNLGCIWNSKQDIFKILQPFRKSGNWQFVLFKGWMIFQTLYFQEIQAFWHQNLQTPQLKRLHIWHSLLGVGQKCMTQHLTATHAMRKIEECGHRWTISFPLQNFLITWQKKLNVVGLSWGNLSKDQGQFASNWMDQTDVCMLTNIHDLPQEVYFCIEMATW